MAGMFDFSPGLNALGGGLDSIGNLVQTYQQQRLIDQRKQEMIDLGQQIQSGDLTGAAAKAISLGDLNTGLKLYQLHRQTADEAGLGQALSGILSGGTAKPAAPGPQASADDTTVSPIASVTQSSAVPGFPDANAYAIGAGEGGTGSNRYSKLGVVIPKTGDRAYGAYQVMGNNIGPWTKEILGQEMTPQEFLANPAAQDAVFKGKFGQYTDKYGPQGAAAMWFSGSPNVNSQARDPLGTSVSGYVSGFSRRLGQPPPGTGLGAAPAAQAITDAMGGVTSPDGTSIVPPVRSAVADNATQPLPMAPDGTPITPAASTTTTGPRPLGPPAQPEDDPEIAAKIDQRNKLIGLMPQAKGTKYETMIPTAIQSLNDQITYMRNRKDIGSQATDRYTVGKSMGLEGQTLRDYVLTGKTPDVSNEAQKEAIVRQQRGADAEQQGLQPGSPAYQKYVLTGQLPTNPNDNPEMKSFQLKAYQTAADKAFAAEQSVNQMQKALKLNDKALSGDFAPSVEGALYRNLPIGVSKHLVDPERVVATTEFNNLATGANLSLGKEMFGARVTNYDEQLLQQLRASVNKSPEERKAILLQLIDNRKQIAAEAARERDMMKSGEYFKKDPGQQPGSVLTDNNPNAPPPGFKQGAGGKFYKPDPANPGKYLMWTPDT